VVLSANELIDSRIKSGNAGVVCTLNIEKTYDHVNWEFLLYVMRRMSFGGNGFHGFAIALLQCPLQYLLMVPPQIFFSASRGLGQADPISPLLFCWLWRFPLGCFTRLLWQVSFQNSVAINIYHLLFADETIIFCDNDCEQMVVIWFEAVSTLNINLAKSSILPVVRSITQLLAGVLGCSIDSFPTSYLVLLRGTKFKNQSIWEPFVERLKRRLSGETTNYLSKRGRLTLIKSVLTSIPTYFLSLFSIPSSMAIKLEFIQRKFLKGSFDSDPRHHSM